MVVVFIGQIMLLSITKIVIHYRHITRNMRWSIDSSSHRIHLAVEGSVGGTTVGLHLSADVIENGGRVLWVGMDMPNPDRFPQLFSHLSPVSSSRFHAMMIAGALDKAIEAVISAANTLPSVKLIVLDEWCESSGKIPKNQLELISKLGTSIDQNIRLLLISKGSVDASGNRKGEIFARAENFFVNDGYEIWTLSRGSTGYIRKLTSNGEVTRLKIEENGFQLLD